MYDKQISENYLLLLLNIDPSQVPTTTSPLLNNNQLNIRNVYSSFITVNREAHVWCQEVYYALEKLQFGGTLNANGLLIKAPKKWLNIIKRVWCQRLLQPPIGFVIGDLVELSNIHVKRQERDPLISLPNVLCLLINDINRRSGGYGASMDEIKTSLKFQYPEFPLPTDDILYSTIGTLIQDKILLLKSGGYITLPCEQAKQIKTQFVTKNHQLHSNEPKSIFSRLLHGFRRRDQHQPPPFIFNAPILAGSPCVLNQQHQPLSASRIVTDYGPIESIDMRQNGHLRASARSHPHQHHHTMRRSSLRTHSTDARQNPPLPSVPTSTIPSSIPTTHMRRPRPRSFSFDEQLSIIDDDDESIIHDMPFAVAPVRSAAPPSQPSSHQHRRSINSKVSSHRRRRRSRSLTKRPVVRQQPTTQQQQQQQQQQHEWLHTTENHQDSSSSEGGDDDDDDDEYEDANEAHFSPRSTSTAANRPRNRKPILHASDFDRRLCEATVSNEPNSKILVHSEQSQRRHTLTGSSPGSNVQSLSSPNVQQHHTSPASLTTTEPDDVNLIIYGNQNDLLNATITTTRTSEPPIMNTSNKNQPQLTSITSCEKISIIRYGSPDSGISGKT